VQLGDPLCDGEAEQHPFDLVEVKTRRFRGGHASRKAPRSNAWLVNFKVRLFAVTVRTTVSSAFAGILASVPNLALTFAPTSPPT
jgi:hypothetical protein